MATVTGYGRLEKMQGESGLAGRGRQTPQPETGISAILDENSPLEGARGTSGIAKPPQCFAPAHQQIGAAWGCLHRLPKGELRSARFTERGEGRGTRRQRLDGRGIDDERQFDAVERRGGLAAIEIATGGQQQQRRMARTSGQPGIEHSVGVSGLAEAEQQSGKSRPSPRIGWSERHQTGGKWQSGPSRRCAIDALGNCHEPVEGSDVG